MSSKVRALSCLLLLLLLLFFFTAPSSAARQLPAVPDATPAPLKTLHGDVEVEKVQVQVQVQDDQVVEESCDGVGEEECLMRRTLAAHLDYIYTQKSKP